MKSNLNIDKELVFNSLYDQYWSDLYSYAFNIMRDRSISEDIVQEIFVDVWQRMDKVSIQNYGAYLHKAVKFQCATKLKSRILNEIQIEKIESVLTLLDDSEYSHDEWKESILQRIESKASEILPERCLHVFRLRFYEKMSYQEIASKLNISVSTVENQVNKALKLLRAEDLLIILAIVSNASQQVMQYQDNITNIV